MLGDLVGLCPEGRSQTKAHFVFACVFCIVGNARLLIFYPASRVVRGGNFELYVSCIEFNHSAKDVVRLTNNVSSTNLFCSCNCNSLLRKMSLCWGHREA